jgi:hypothetical protein
LYLVVAFLIPPLFALLAISDRKRGAGIQILGALWGLITIGIPLVVLVALLLPTITARSLARLAGTPAVITTPSVAAAFPTSLPLTSRPRTSTPVVWIPPWAPDGAIKSYMAPDHLGQTVWVCGPVQSLARDQCSGLAKASGKCQPDEWATLYLGTGISTSNPIVSLFKSAFEVGPTYWQTLVGNPVCAHGQIENLKIYSQDGSSYYEQLAVEVTSASEFMDGR